MVHLFFSLEATVQLCLSLHIGPLTSPYTNNSILKVILSMFFSVVIWQKRPHWIQSGLFDAVSKATYLSWQWLQRWVLLTTNVEMKVHNKGLWNTPVALTSDLTMFFAKHVFWKIIQSLVSHCYVKSRETINDEKQHQGGKQNDFDLRTGHWFNSSSHTSWNIHVDASDSSG